MGRAGDLWPGNSTGQRRSNQSGEVAGSLPAHDAREARTLPFAAPARATRVKTKVLIIEDSSEDATIYKRLLEEMGYAADVATSGAEGLPRAQSGAYEVVLTDLNLGGLKHEEGRDVVEQLHAANPHLPVILMT